jgi:hypothetical protein
MSSSASRVSGRLDVEVQRTCRVARNPALSGAKTSSSPPQIAINIILIAIPFVATSLGLTFRPLTRFHRPCPLSRRVGVAAAVRHLAVPLPPGLADVVRGHGGGVPAPPLGHPPGRAAPTGVVVVVMMMMI